MTDRIKKSFLNARISFIFYFLFLLLSFFSRKIFLDSLGAEFIGLTGTLQNILGLLSLAELGVGTAINFYLYKPIFEKDYEKVSEIVSLFGWLYRYIGLAILSLGIILSLFFPIIFDEVGLNLFVVYFSFYTLLFSSLIGYFINFRQVLLGADQKSYIVSVYIQGGMILKILIQMWLCNFHNYYLWISADLIFATVSCLFLNWKISNEYPWLKVQLSNGRNYVKRNPYILKDVKRVFVHKFKDFLLSQSDQILIFIFVSLKMVAYYGNYALIFSKISSLFVSVFNSISAGIGDLVAENDKEKINNIFWELMVTRFYFSGIIVAFGYFLVNPFISLWLGDEYILSKTVVLLLCVNTYFMLTRGVVDSFNHAYGLYADIWSAWTEAIINITITVSVALHFGLIGVLLGKTVSLVFIVLWWKPLYLFRCGFKKSAWYYFRRVSLYYLGFIILGAFIYFLDIYLEINPSSSISEFIEYSLIIVISGFGFFSTLMLIAFPEMKAIINRIKSNF